MSDWTLLDIQKKVGQECGDPDATGYPNAIKAHITDAIESLASDIVTIADSERALNDAERNKYAEILNLSENEISPMLQEVTITPSYSNGIAVVSVTNANFPKAIKIRDLFSNPQNATKIKFHKLNSMKEFNRKISNPHLRPETDEAVWFNSGNKIYINYPGSQTRVINFSCFVSIDYSAWTATTDLQTLGFGTGFLEKVIDRASYTMRLQLGFEKR